MDARCTKTRDRRTRYPQAYVRDRSTQFRRTYVTGRPLSPYFSDRSANLSEDDLAALALVAEGLDRLVQDVGGLGVGAALLHVREVRLVGLDLRRRWRVLGVEARRQAAPWTVPGLGRLRLDREGHQRPVLLGAEIADVLARSG